MNFFVLMPNALRVRISTTLLGYKLDWSVYTCLTQLYGGRDMYIMYYIKSNYMFRHLTLAIFRLRNKKRNSVSSYTRLMWAVYSGEVRGEVCMIPRMRYVGWVVWVHGFCYYMLYLGYIVGSRIAYNSRTHVPTPPILHNACEVSYTLHLLPPHCIQPT